MRQKFIYTLWISFFALIGILACSDEPEANFPIEETEPIAEEDELQLILTASETTVYVSSAILFEVAAGEEPVNGADIYINDIKIAGQQHSFDVSGIKTVIAKKVGYIDSPPLEITVIDKATDVDIYIIGQAASESRTQYQPLYWINGEWHPFQHEYIGDFVFHAFTLANGQLHVAGERLYSSSRSTVFHWSEDTYDELSEDNSFASGKDIAVSGGDIYIGGLKNKSSSVMAIGYWKNGNWKELSSGSVGSTDGGPIVVKDDNIYFAGIVNGVPKYWKNGVELQLDGGSAAVTSLAVADNGDVYVAGYSFGLPNVAVYWKNGERIVLSDGNSQATDIFVYENDVYVSGWEIVSLPTGGRSKSIARYWKNGDPVDLSDGTERAEANGIYVVDGNPYVVGVEYKSPVAAILWKDGETIRLSHDEFNGSAEDIYVVKK